MRKARKPSSRVEVERETRSDIAALCLSAYLYATERKEESEERIREAIQTSNKDKHVSLPCMPYLIRDLIITIVSLRPCVTS
jgi:hypothetical protein